MNRDGWASGDIGYRVNCQKCVTAYELRRRGYDVKAKPTIGGAPIVDGWQVDQAPNFIAGRWRNSDGSRPNVWDRPMANKSAVDREVESWGDRGRGFVVVRWKSPDDGAHVFIAENRGGKAVYLDPQSGLADASGHFKHVGWRKHLGGCFTLRTDTLEYAPRHSGYDVDDLVEVLT